MENDIVIKNDVNKVLLIGNYFFSNYEIKRKKVEQWNGEMYDFRFIKMQRKDRKEVY